MMPKVMDDIDGWGESGNSIVVDMGMDGWGLATRTETGIHKATDAQCGDFLAGQQGTILIVVVSKNKVHAGRHLRTGRGVKIESSRSEHII